jgi:hypothetical protein
VTSNSEYLHHHRLQYDGGDSRLVATLKRAAQRCAWQFYWKFYKNKTKMEEIFLMSSEWDKDDEEWGNK